MPDTTTSSTHTVTSMAAAAFAEIAGAVLLEKMNEHPKAGAAILTGGGLTIAAIGAWKFWKLSKNK